MQSTGSGQCINTYVIQNNEITLIQGLFKIIYCDRSRYWALKQDELAPWNGPGHWNDPDMLEIGNEGQWGAKGNMTAAEKQSHMALWSMFAAPLILGGDVRTLSAADLAIVSNSHLIKINQDAAGTQGKCIRGCPLPAAAEPWGELSLANFTAKSKTTERQVFTLPEPLQMVAGIRLAAFSQYEQWQPNLVEVEFQTADGAWLTNNHSACANEETDAALPEGVRVAAASGSYATAGTVGKACAAADGNLSTFWDAVSEPQTGRYWIEFAFGSKVALKAVAITSPNDLSHDLKDFGLLPAGSPADVHSEPVQLWTKPLSGGSMAAMLFNPGDAPQVSNFTMAELGLKCATGAVQDVWVPGKETAKLGTVEAQIATHGTAGFICSCA